MRVADAGRSVSEEIIRSEKEKRTRSRPMMTQSEEERLVHETTQSENEKPAHEMVQSEKRSRSMINSIWPREQFFVLYSNVSIVWID